MEDQPISVAEAAEKIAGLMHRPSVLDVTHEFASRFVWLPEEELDAYTAWLVHTHVFKAFYASPRLCVRGKRGSGKSTVLKVGAVLSKTGLRCSNASLPSIYTIIEQRSPTIFLDEVDRWLTRQSGYTSGQRGELVGILNDGYTEDAYVWRQVDHVAHEYPVYVACAFGGIGRMPDTLEDRSVILDMEKKPASVHLKQWDPKKYGPEAKRINLMLQGWAQKEGPELDPEPDLPKELGDNREYQIWQSLISIGDHEGPEWSQRIRAAALKLACGISAKPAYSPAEELVMVIAEYSEPSEFLPTGDLLDRLRDLQREHGVLSWATWLNDRIAGSRHLASLLRGFGIESEQKWLDGENRRGYAMGSFHMWTDSQEA